MILSRKPESKTLETLFHQKKPAFLAVYGRRRIGKTYLINRFFSAKSDCEFIEVTGAAGASRAEQLRNFGRVIDEVAPPSFTTWDEALHALWLRIKALPKTRKIVVFFDELPWLAGQKSGFLTALDFFWNRRLSRRDNTLLIVCGSAAAWIIHKVIDDRGGLHNRVTDRMPMLPFTVAETADYLAHRGIRWERPQVLELHMALGGVALYLDHIERGESVTQNIDRICFGSGSFLRGEFARLFRSLFGEEGHHVAIVRALAQTNQGLQINDLLAATQLRSGGTVSKVLEELVLSGFVEPTQETWKKRKGTRYRLIDEFSLFHLTWIEGTKKGTKPPTGPGTWLRLQESGRFNTWTGYAFENFCFRHKEQLIDALGLTVVADSVSTWSIGPDPETGERGAQIDLVIDRRDRCMNLCEMKYSQREYSVTKRMAADLDHKRYRFRSAAKTKALLLNTLVTPHSAKKNTHYLANVDQLVTLDDFFT